MVKDISGFAELQEKPTFGLGYKLTLTKNTDNVVLNKDNAINNAKIRILAIGWYVPHSTRSISNQAILSKQILRMSPTVLQYVERFVFMKEVNTQNFWTFELGTQERNNIPAWVFTGFHQRDRQDSQNLNNDIFYRPPVTNAQCIIGTENYPDSGVILHYNDDDYSQAYGQIKEVFRALTKDDILQPYISDNDFR